MTDFKQIIGRGTRVLDMVPSNPSRLPISIVFSLIRRAYCLENLDSTNAQFATRRWLPTRWNRRRSCCEHGSRTQPLDLLLIPSSGQGLPVVRPIALLSRWRFRNWLISSPESENGRKRSFPILGASKRCSREKKAKALQISVKFLQI